MTNEPTPEVIRTKPAVEVSFKSYSKMPETEDGFELTVTSEAVENDVDRTTALAVKARLMARLAIAMGGEAYDRDLSELLADSVEALRAKRALEAEEG